MTPTNDARQERAGRGPWPFSEHMVTIRETTDGYLAACTCWWAYENTSPSFALRAMEQHALAVLEATGAVPEGSTDLVVYRLIETHDEARISQERWQVE
jgi:hypothetical protein